LLGLQEYHYACLNNHFEKKKNGVSISNYQQYFGIMTHVKKLEKNPREALLPHSLKFLRALLLLKTGTDLA
jgi:hypothetical protein